MTSDGKSYSHVVELDEEKRILSIYRLYADGRKVLLTSAAVPVKSFSEDEQGFRSFAQMLGENVLIDSPVARRLLGL